MQVPYWADRPYLPIPVGEITTVLDYARFERAAGLVYDSSEDLSRRPHLYVLLEQPPPPGLRLTFSMPLPEAH